ncbi:MAG: hypothetical protein MJ204_08530 [Bacteroidales bacterium]|nr:hypothetical protein [Bacteroidales bacterium]
MREHLKILFALIFSLCGCSLVAQEIESVSQNEKKNVAFSLGIGPVVIEDGISIESTNKDLLSIPTVNISISTAIKKKIFLGLDYEFIKSSGKAIDTWHRYPCREYDFDIYNNIFSLNIGYCFDILNFYIMPKFSLGLNNDLIKCSDFDDNYSIEQKSLLMCYPTIQCGYKKKNMIFFLQCHPISYERKIVSRIDCINGLSFPFKYKYCVLNVGIGFLL